MLQQTQVGTVIPYFERWMKRLPDLAALAAAELDEVLALWSGLGYYARARNLHRAAQICVQQHAGRLPDAPEELSALPGVGMSTANAIVSQAHNIPLPILDGNARRVLARHAAVDGWPGKASTQRELWRQAQLRVPRDRGADYTQAIMDLGAIVCIRTSPACASCPVAFDCRAFMTGEVERYPAPNPASAVEERSLFMLILQRPDGAVLLERRPPAGIWGGLWCLPEGPALEALAERFGLEPGEFEPLAPVEHRLTHRKLIIHPARYSGVPSAGAEDSGSRWRSGHEWGELGIPVPVLKLLRGLVAGQR